MSISKQVTIAGLGLLSAIMPFLGFPGAWKTGFIVIFGLTIAVLSLLMIAKERLHRPHSRFFDAHRFSGMERRDRMDGVVPPRIL